MAQANPPAPAPQPEQNDLTGSQLASVRNYTGADQDDVELWIAHVNRVKRGFGWTDVKAGQVAKNKLVEKAAKWLEAMISQGGEVAGWDNLSKNLLDRLKKEQTDVTAALAMGELQQGSIESAAS